MSHPIASENLMRASAGATSLSSMPLLVAAAILVVYIVLGVLYESYIPSLYRRQLGLLV
jgi:hypothetical protein